MASQNFFIPTLLKYQIKLGLLVEKMQQYKENCCISSDRN